MTAWGYRIVNCDGKLRQTARIIWKIMTGSDPVDEVDHRNTIGSDNRWKNLRAATRGQNNVNQKVRRTNQLGVKGVYRSHSKSTRFGARIVKAKKLIGLGTFDTIEEAHAAYCAAAKELHGEFLNAG